jgi:hypothetical protein
MSRKASVYTIAEIVARQGVSESQALRRMKAIKTATMVYGYNGRQVRAWSKEQVAAAFPKKSKAKA